MAFLATSPGGDQHARVRGVGAAGDRGDDHVAVADVVLASADREAAGRGLAVAVLEIGEEALVHIVERDLVLRPLGPGERGNDAAHVEPERVGEHRLGRIRIDPQPLFARIGLDQRDLVLLAAGEPQVVERLVVDPEEAAGRAVLGRHVGERRAVGEAQRAEAGAVIFDEAADHALGAQHLRGGEHQVGGGDALGEPAGQPEAHHLGDQHRDRLAEHRRLGLDPADAPAEHAQAVDHRGVAVGADARVGIGDEHAVLVVARPHAAADMLEVDLVADAGARRHRVEVVEAFRAPLEEVVALEVALVFDLDVLLERLGVAELVDHHRMVDHQVHRDQRVDLRGVAAELGDRVAHRREVDHAGDAGEILHQHARRAVLDLLVRPGRMLLPVDQRLDMIGRDGEAAVLEAQQVLEQDLHRERQPRHVAELLAGLGLSE